MKNQDHIHPVVFEYLVPYVLSEKWERKRNKERSRNVARDVIGLNSTPRWKCRFFHNKVKQLPARPVGTDRCSIYFFALFIRAFKTSWCKHYVTALKLLCRRTVWPDRHLVKITLTERTAKVTTWKNVWTECGIISQSSGKWTIG